MRYETIVTEEELNEDRNISGILKDVINSGKYKNTRFTYCKNNEFCVIGAIMDFITGSNQWMFRTGVIEEDIIKEYTGIDIPKNQDISCNLCHIKNEKYSVIDYCIHLNDYHKLDYNGVYEELVLIEK